MDEENKKVQNTSNDKDADSKKIRNTIEKFEKFGLNNNYEKLYIFGFLECKKAEDAVEKIKAISEKESCIFLSCKANTVLASSKNAIRIFITSSKVVHKETDSDYTNATAYDLCINTALIGKEGAVQVILEYLTAKSY